MIIHSIRLKNIKSYGEGPDGKGIMVSFEEGTNGISGKNGHGKTTLVESLGYALFLTKPQSEETLDKTTYLLRAGAKAGEIDVTFSHGGERYRIECGLGTQNKRRTKVVQITDEGICAEGDREVAQFLCELLDFEGLDRLSETFSKLIGVKQGRLTWPFDSKPKEAKEFFEPLLDVAIFRDCFDQLKPAVDHFEQQRQDWKEKIAAVDERIHERRESPALVERQRRTMLAFEKQLGALIEALESALKAKQEMELREAQVKEAEREREAARNAQVLAVERTKDIARQVQESQSAAETVAQATSSYLTFQGGEAALTELRKRQVEQQKLERQKGEAVQQKTELEGKAREARSKAEIFAEQKGAKERELEALRAELRTLRERLERTKDEFGARKSAAAQAREDLSHLGLFSRLLEQQLKKQEVALQRINALAKEVGGWDPAALERSQREEAGADQTFQSARQELAQAKQRHQTLAEQIKEISGGICPFLKEKCRQFDPTKVGTDLQHTDAAVVALQGRLGPLDAALQSVRTRREKLQRQEAALGQKSQQLDGLAHDFAQELAALCPDGIPGAAGRLARWAPEIGTFPAFPSHGFDSLAMKNFEGAYRKNRAFGEAVATWWPQVQTAAQIGLEGFADVERTRGRDEQNLVHLTKQEAGLVAETGKLEADEKGQCILAAQLDASVKEAIKELDKRDEQLQRFATLTGDMTKQEQLLETHRAGYLRYIEAKPVASQLGERQEILESQKATEAKTASAFKTREGALLELQKTFDGKALAKARLVFDEKNAELATHRANLGNAKIELDRFEKQFAEWQAARAEQEKINAVLCRLEASIALTELARKILRDSAPTVALRLCNRIAARAKQIFNQINHEPVELAWEATRYSLRIEPGGRHFAMLSGGEQTKLALAMTLAMIQEFSGLRFAVFDEPTYAVDADSRQKLADAILEAQKAAALEQLIVVSHDDAFEGKIEHVVMLRKSAAGTEEVQRA